jgi:hypothetical protein
MGALVSGATAAADSEKKMSNKYAFDLDQNACINSNKRATSAGLIVMDFVQ